MGVGVLLDFDKVCWEGFLLRCVDRVCCWGELLGCINRVCG